MVREKTRAQKKRLLEILAKPLLKYLSCVFELTGCVNCAVVKFVTRILLPTVYSKNTKVYDYI